MKASRQNVREHGEIFDLRHGLVFVWKLDQVEVCIRNKYILRLPPDPTTHVHIAIGSAGTARIHVEADAGLLFAAGAAAPAGNVERNSDEISDLKIFDVGTGLYYFSGNFVSQDHAGRSGGAAADHMLVRAADIG